MHAFLEWLQKHWSGLVVYALWVLIMWRGQRGTRRSWRERVAIHWPAVEGRAWCRRLPGTRVSLSVDPVDGSEPADWAHTFSCTEEGRHYRTVLNGLTVPVHVNPEKPRERIVCWREMTALVPAFGWPDGGRMSPSAFRGVRVFQTVLLGAGLLLAADAGMFAVPRIRDAEWHGMCLCELSIGLLVLSVFLLLYSVGLRRRMDAADLAKLPELAQRGTRWVLACTAGAWFGLALFAAAHHGETPDPVWWGLLTLPVVAFLWVSAGVALRAERTLRPLAFGVPHEPEGSIEAERKDVVEQVEASGVR